MRLKAAYAADIPHICRSFNSIKVRLKVLLKLINITVVKEFQFHKGAIKSIAGAVKGSTWNVFQFHKGAIKRLGMGHSVTGRCPVSIP